MDRRGRSDRAFRLGVSNPGSFGETAGGAIFNAARALRRLGTDVVVVSGRGGDGDGKLVAKAIRGLGAADASITWLDRRTPTYTALLDETGDLVGGLADMRLYDVMQPKVFVRRHLRDALAAADALIVDANLPERTIAYLVDAAGPIPVSAIGVSPAKVGRLGPVLSRLAAVFL